MLDLFLIFIIFNILDVITTKLALEANNHERNLFVLFVYKQLGGIFGLVFLKIVMLTLIFYYLASFSYSSLVLLNIILCLVVLNNVWNWLGN